MPTKVWYEIIYPVPNFNGCTVDVWEWNTNFSPHFVDVNYLSMLGLSYSILVKRARGISEPNMKNGIVLLTIDNILNKSCHDANVIVTGGKGRCRYDKWCCRQQHSWYRNNHLVCVNEIRNAGV